MLDLLIFGVTIWNPTYSNKCSLLLLLIWLWFWLHVLLMEPSCSEYMQRDTKKLNSVFCCLDSQVFCVCGDSCKFSINYVVNCKKKEHHTGTLFKVVVRVIHSTVVVISVITLLRSINRNFR